MTLTAWRGAAAASAPFAPGMSYSPYACRGWFVRTATYAQRRARCASQQRPLLAFLTRARTLLCRSRDASRFSSLGDAGTLLALAARCAVLRTLLISSFLLVITLIVVVMC